jgi:FMN phosphatase YigB (HAD superfamily)
MRRAIIFDLDGTLYDAKGLDAQNRSAAICAVKEFMRVSKKEATAIILQKQGSTEGLTSISRALFSLGVPDDVFKKFQLKLLKPEEFIVNDGVLVSLVRNIKSEYKLVLHTNTRKELVLPIISCIGFRNDDFDLIVAGGDVEEPKPSVAELRKILTVLAVNPAECYAVGDRWLVDLAPAKILGMKTIHVASRGELVHWLQSIS